MAAMVLCALALGALGALRPARALLPALDVDLNINDTVCPVVVVMDDDPLRIPVRIKTRVCAPDPQAECRARDLSADRCCDGRYSENYGFECVQLMDSTSVTYEVQEDDITVNRWEFIDVPVGCTCAVREFHKVDEAPSGPSRRGVYYTEENRKYLSPSTGLQPMTG